MAKLWDLNTGKLLHSFEHPSPVVQIVFHPEELILGCVLSDGNIWFWDMDAWTCISNSHTMVSNAPKYLVFHPAGQHSLFLSKDQCGVYEWESMKSVDSMELQWHAASLTKDATITKHNQLIAASFSEVMVSIFQLDLGCLLPFRNDILRYTGSESALPSSIPSPVTSIPSKSHSLPSSLQSSYSSLSNLPLLPPITSSVKKNEYGHDEDNHALINEICMASQNETSAILSSSLSLTHPPLPSFSITLREGPPILATDVIPSIPKTSPDELTLTTSTPYVQNLSLPASSILSNLDSSTLSVTATNLSDLDSPSPTFTSNMVTNPTAKVDSDSPSSSSSSLSLHSYTSTLNKRLSNLSLETSSTDSLNVTLTPRLQANLKSHNSVSPIIKDIPSSEAFLSPTSPPPIVQHTTAQHLPCVTTSPGLLVLPAVNAENSSSTQPLSIPSLPTPPIIVTNPISPTISSVVLNTSPITPPDSPFISCSGHAPLYLDLHSIVNGCPTPSTLPRTSTPQALSAPHNSVMSILTNRLQFLSQIQSHWRQSLHNALLYTQGARQHAIYIDILRVLSRSPTILTLDVCVIVLPWLSELLFEPLEDYLITACTMIKLILIHFAPLITTTLGAPPPMGVDFSREARIDKCLKCKTELLAIQQILKELSNTPGDLGNSIRDTLNSFPANGF
ncbi:Katanin p80 WD40 repeat-containing subunit B1 [Coelomomyces lativittatus]|nr:Katanin p80 WD40 repeat-containing subunit B1 [Coelomomyces lativittatus]